MNKLKELRRSIENIIRDDLAAGIANLLINTNEKEIMKIYNINDDVEIPNNVKWGNWHLNKEAKCIDFIDQANNYLLYKFDLKDLDNNKPHTIWRGIDRIARKGTLTDKDMSDLITALSELVGYKGYWKTPGANKK